MYHLIEEIYVNNTPTGFDTPFYNNETRRITDLKPHAERLYFNNLGLTYKKNVLTRKTDSYWIHPAVLASDDERSACEIVSPSFPVAHSPTGRLHAIKQWDYTIAPDYESNFVVSPIVSRRQRIKRYSENILAPVIHAQTVILRNEYRLYCLDRATGRQIWTLSPDKSGHEFYETLRHPHHNSYGYELLVDTNVVYAELAHSLTAVSIEDLLHPRLLWQQGLGEYTVSVKPLRYEGTLIVGLTNAKGELWVCAFQADMGALLWSTYIGITSFLSPVSTLSLMHGNTIIMGTNHGVLLSIRPDTGDIIWLKKYSPKTYSINDYWHKEYYREKWLEHGFIPFDTQFINIDTNGVLYYKPRESDYVYIVHAQNGDQIQERLIDSHRHFLLTAQGGSMVLLEGAHKGKRARLKVVDIRTNNQIYNETVKAGMLQGVVQLNSEETAFKIDKTVYVLSMRAENIALSQMEERIPGWLLNVENNILFTGDERTLNCLTCGGHDIAVEHNGDAIRALFKKRDSIQTNLIKAIESGLDSQKEQILHDIETSGLPAQYLISVIENNSLWLKDQSWRSFFLRLHTIYKDAIITYEDIEIKFTNFMYALGLAEIGEQYNTTAAASARAASVFQVEGVRVTVLPIHVIDGRQRLNFFIALNFDQVLCVEETGEIRWQRTIFHLSRKINYERMPQRAGITYLYKDVLIIADGVNIVAVNVGSGDYIWSMTNKGITDKSKLYNLDNCVTFHLAFLNDKIIIAHGSQIYSVHPVTGYCERVCALDMQSASEMIITDNRIYLLNDSLKKIYVLNDKLEEMGTFKLNFVKKKKNTLRMLALDDYIVFALPPQIYLLGKKSGKVEDTITIGTPRECYIENYNNNILALIPFKKLMYITARNSALEIDWVLPLESDDASTVIVNKMNGKPYFLVDEYIMLPIKKNGTHRLQAVALASGQTIWEEPLAGVKGIFMYVSDYIRLGNSIYFIFSTGMEDYHEGRSPHMKAIMETDAVYNIESRIVHVNIASGEVRMTKKFPRINTYGYKKPMVTATQQLLIYALHNNVWGVGCDT